jgi:peroxiredoxin
MNLNSSYEVSNKMAAMFIMMTTILVVINILLMGQNKKLKSSVEKGGRSMEIQPGTQLPPITGIDLNGNQFKLDYGQDPRKTLLLVFSPSCRFCKENMPNWEAIMGGVDKNSFRVTGISLMENGLKEYLAQYGLSDLPIVAEMDPQARAAYNLILSPQTILIDSEGKAERVWTGLIEGEKKAELERILNIQLPVAEKSNPADNRSIAQKQDGRTS